MKFIRKIRIRDYRSFVDETVVLDDDLTTIVGANEGGKTNVLNAVSHLKAGQKFKKDDLRKGAKNYPNGIIQLDFYVSLNKKLTPDVIALIPELEGREFVISKKGGVGGEKPEYTYSLENASGIEKIVEICKTAKFREKFEKSDIKRFEKDLARKWFTRRPDINLTKNPFAQLRKSGAIKILSGEKQLSDFLAPIVFAEIQSKLKIYFWKYDKSSFLQNLISISELLGESTEETNENLFRIEGWTQEKVKERFNAPDGPERTINLRNLVRVEALAKNQPNHETTKNLFRIAGWTDEDIERNFTDLDQSDIAIKLKEVENEINSLIKKKWRQHKKLRVHIQRSGEELVIHLDETNALTKPELRSDGLKWFLSFLINFRAQSKTLTEYLILIDEPALHLHPRGQKDVLAEIAWLAEENQVVYTTHQTFMIDKNHPERVRVLHRESIKSDGNDYYFASVVNNQLKTKDITTDPLLRESLGFSVSDISPINEKNLLVEGVFDRGLIQLLNEYEPLINFEEISVIACGGAPEIRRQANFLLSQGLSVAVIYDSDESGQRGFNDNDPEYQLSAENRAHIKSLDKSFKGFETPEDLFDEGRFQEVTSKIKELKAFKLDKGNKPRMAQLKVFMDKSGLEKDSALVIKHKLEDALLLSLRDDLDQNKITTKHPLRLYIKAVSKHLNCLES